MNSHKLLILSALIALTVVHNVAGNPAVIPTSAVLIPNIGQYLAAVQILTLKLVIATQILRLLGLDYVGKGIKSEISEEHDDYEGHPVPVGDHDFEEMNDDLHNSASDNRGSVSAPGSRPQVKGKRSKKGPTVTTGPPAADLLQDQAYRAWLSVNHHRVMNKLTQDRDRKCPKGTRPVKGQCRPFRTVQFNGPHLNHYDNVHNGPNLNHFVKYDDK
ncbi:hypothetical protein HDE_09267 [Halotydeus destructor]|nr:hypothetical protein HDE_09267 [Halotydeus destructor]